MEDNGQKDDGSVWASYSDLFTNVAIIFLVMFVFALIKAGVSKMETALTKKKHELELKAKLSENDIKRSEEKVKKVEDSINEMQKVEVIVDEKIKEMQEFAKSMENNKELLKELIDEQRRKDSILNTVNGQINEKENLIRNLQTQTESLSSRISQMEEEKLNIENKYLETQKISEVDKKKIRALEDDIKEIAQFKEQKQFEIDQLKKITEKNFITIQDLENQKLDLDQKIKLSSQSIKELQNNKELLEKKMQDLAQVHFHSESTINELKSKIAQVEGEKGNILNQLKSSQMSQQELKESLNQLNQNLNQKISEYGHLKNLHEKSLSQVDSLGSQLKDAQDKMKNLGKALYEMKGKLRSSIADSLKRKFQAQSIDVLVNSETGSVTLLMGDNFLFKKNSFELSPKAELALNKIGPIYAEVIFSDNHLSSKIEAIEIIGHSSPSYKKEYVDPMSENPEAYALNMRLSAQRAASIANYMMGKKIGLYPYKTQLKESLYSIGRGYISPITKTNIQNRTIASDYNHCGPFDCDLSQRVEIGFKLKDDIKAIEKLINMAGVK